MSDSTLQLTDFHVFPKHVGVWEGNWVILDSDCHEVQRFTAVLTQKIINNQWIQTNHHTYANGSSNVQDFVGTVVGLGQVQIESNAPPFNSYTTLAAEQGDDLILFKVWDKATDAIRAIELINLISESERVRTTQSFTSEGKLRGIMVIVEHRIGY
jgi:hypothetical protein